MKKVIFTLFVLCSIGLMTSKAQTSYKEVFENANGRFHWHFGLLGGSVGLYDNMTRGCIGMSITIRGMYGDLLVWPSLYKNSTNIGTWTSPTCLSYHFGYQIPVSRHWRIIPVAGYYKAGYTITDGHHYNVTSSGIQNHEYDGDNVHGFDYGAVVVYHFLTNSPGINLNLGVTRHTLYGGVSLNIY